jgi:protein TonB
MTAAQLDTGGLRRWMGSAALVLGLHAAAAALLLTWHEPIAVGVPSNAIFIDLTPFVAPDSDTKDDIAPGPLEQEAEAPPPEQRQTEPKVDEKVELPPTPVPPVAALPINPQPPKATPDVIPPAPATTAPPPARASQAQIKSWAGRVVTQIERHKAYPHAAEQRGERGVVELAFSIDREGRVVSTSIVKSSGHAALDQESIATVHRAEPLPAPPIDLEGNRFDFTVPLKFNIR